MMRTGVLFVIFVFALSGCFRVSVSDIKDNPQKYSGKQVLISGEVTETLSIPFVQEGIYQVNDGTGKIWVISQARVPSRGENVTVKGEVKTGFTIADRTFGTVIAEEEK
jgi:hypothetical protein